MLRRSISNAVKADRYFPIRLRVAVPPRGFGQQLNTMRDWLQEQVGAGSYWIGSEAGPGKTDAALFYFLDASSAHAFVERFACGVMLVRGMEQERPL